MNERLAHRLSNTKATTGRLTSLLGALVDVRCVPGVLAPASVAIPSSACAASRGCSQHGRRCLMQAASESVRYQSFP
jgi:hypothetical protein